MNLFHVAGDHTTNVIRRTVSFENIDISTTHSTPPGGATDGSGFILDQNSSGALFENNLGFRNGGSCIRINTPGAYLVNNTCYHDGLNPNDRSPSSGLQGAVMINNLAAASGFDGTQRAFDQASGSNNVGVDASGATPFFANPAALDFRPVPNVTPAAVDRGTTTSAPATDIGFDGKCVKAQTPQAGQPAWWSYTIDYDYIRSVGGVAGCFHPATRPAGAAPDVGAYEYGSTPAPGTGGATGTGGAAGTGGPTGAGGAGGSGGAAGAGGASGSGSGGGGGATDAGAASDGARAAGGAAASGCACDLPGGRGAGGAPSIALAALAALAFRRRSRT